MGELETGMKQRREKSEARGKAILLALIDFWENNVISASLSTHTPQTHSDTHINLLVIERANKSLWKTTCIRSFFFFFLFFFTTKKSSKGRAADLERSKSNRPEIETETNSLLNASVCVLAVVSQCWFIYIQHCMRARGDGRGKPMEDGNRKSEPGDILAVVNEPRG